MVEYEQHRLKLIDLPAPPTMINESALIQALAQYMVTSRYTKNTDEIVLRLDTNEKKVKHITWHYGMLQTHDKKEDQSKLKQICIIPRQDANQQSFRLRMPPSRFLTELTWVPDNRAKELLPGMHEVCIHILVRFAQLDEHQPHMNRDTEPGSDFVGTVIRVGPTASFQTGDHVVGISIGAGVIATAGTKEKRRFLREHCGIEYVFNSRDTSFASGVRSMLSHGVDVVTNSLSGILLQESIKLLADHGHFVEWGKRDVFDKSSLSMFDFRSDCSFHVIDLVSLCIKHPNICTTMLKEMVDLLMQSKLKAIEPTVVYEPSQVIEACMRRNSGQAMGKAVVRLTNSNESLCLNSIHHNNLIEDNDVMFPSNVYEQGTVLISGGFGGLGLTISRWMIEKRGVKRIILMSRRTLAEFEQSSNPQYEDWLRLKQTINEYQAHLDVVQADVTNFDQVYDLIKKLSHISYPVRGVIHSAVVAEDRTLAKMT
ncbi:unnamed protein product [Adineta steineri]|uniref:Enoyl reductase (ER) domain-containing protein n=1 Tax=Adineta steineri TaxID=433720 RepID=A0A813T4F4_9BILA|nr:unnamed protein product [Adineta steineri]CAF3740038.1 unnamed protein product [Adineta steineri]